MVIGGMIFQTQNHIDHFCISQKFWHSLEDVRFIRGADVGSDHNLIFAKLGLKFKKYRTGNLGRRLKFKVSLLQSTEKRGQNSNWANRFQALEELQDLKINTHWGGIKGVMTATCNVVLGHKTHTENDWIAQESPDKIQKHREMKAEMNNSQPRTERKAAQEKYSGAKPKSKEVYKETQKQLFGRTSRTGRDDSWK